MYVLEDYLRFWEYIKWGGWVEKTCPSFFDATYNRDVVLLQRDKLGRRQYGIR